MESIQDWLISQGFDADQGEQAFIKFASYFHKISIPFSALEGRSMQSFQALAKHKGWIAKDEPCTI